MYLGQPLALGSDFVLQSLDFAILGLGGSRIKPALEEPVIGILQQQGK
jgi:hypothetical protein